MTKKGGNFFEEHIEKIVLAIVGVVCLWLLISRVLISPNTVSYDNKKFGSGDIDIYIDEQAKLLKYQLSREPEPMKPFDPCFPAFVALVDSAVSNINTNTYIPIPTNSSKEVGPKPKYRLPVIGEVNDVGVEHFRAVVYAPTKEINAENVYNQADSEPNDLDFVTVEGRFDVAKLAEDFYKSFTGEDVNEQWRDPCLATVVFAAVQLQRQQLLADGSWSDLEIVPRTRIDPRREMFEVVENVEELPAGGVKIRLLEFNDAQVKMDLLQPEIYQIASAKEDWFPPSLHKKYVEHQKAIEAQEKREALEAKKTELEQQREKARAERSERGSSRKSKTGTSSAGGEGYDSMGGMGMGFGADMMGSGTGISTTRERKGRTGLEERKERKEQQRKERLEKSKELPSSISDIESEFDGILITDKTDIAKMEEPLVFWAHDDTVEPDKTYRYRIRLGVFNPIAGTNQFDDQDEPRKDNVILWSGFSDWTELVEIPGTLYFFPLDIQEATGTVTIQVCRYSLGYWYSKDFMVRQGEAIGRAVESENAEGESDATVTIPEMIDYTTGAVLVDIMPVNDWSDGKNMRARHYFDMLYSLDVTNINRMPIKKRYWARELQVEFDKIKESEKEPKEPLRPWGTRAGRERMPQGPGPMMPGFEGMMMNEEFMRRTAPYDNMPY